jgi:hypothetical protein
MPFVTGGDAKPEVSGPGPTEVQTIAEMYPFEDAQIPSVWLQWCDSGGAVSGGEAYGA